MNAVATLVAAILLAACEAKLDEAVDLAEQAEQALVLAGFTADQATEFVESALAPE